jgi:hypothetical protein
MYVGVEQKEGNFPLRAKKNSCAKKKFIGIGRRVVKFLIGQLQSKHRVHLPTSPFKMLATPGPLLKSTKSVGTHGAHKVVKRLITRFQEPRMAYLPFKVYSNAINFQVSFSRTSRASYWIFHLDQRDRTLTHTRKAAALWWPGPVTSIRKSWRVLSARRPSVLCPHSRRSRSVSLPRHGQMLTTLWMVRHVRRAKGNVCFLLKKRMPVTWTCVHRLSVTNLAGIGNGLDTRQTPHKAAKRAHRPQTSRGN